MIAHDIASQDYFKLMADNMIDMVALHEPDGTYTYISPSVEDILGYKPEELLGKSPYPLFHEEDIERIESESHRQAIAGKKVISTEYRIRKKNGDYIWFDTNTMPIIDVSGQVIKLQTVSREITEKKENELALHLLNHELGELNKQKDKLLSVISHDLRSPFNSLQGLFNLVFIDYEAFSKEELYKLLSDLKKQTDNSLGLLQDLLLWSRNQFNVLEVECKSINAKATVQPVIGHLRHQATEKGITVSNNIPTDIALTTDEHMFKTIFRNLISNAIKFSRRDSEVRLEAKKQGKFYDFSVIDTGCGIAPEIIEKILSVKCIHTTPGTNGEKGFGLGISICKDFIDKLGGHLYIKSKVDKGSTFTFTIPKD